jgi:hypothetical protein
MELIRLTQCGGASCPAVYSTGQTIIVQGNLMTATVPEIELGHGEALVEIPRDVFYEAVGDGTGSGSRSPQL